MIKVIAHGHDLKKIVRRFICRNCGCMFDADSEDYQVSHAQYNDTVFEAVCPECGDRAFSYPEVYKR